MQQHHHNIIWILTAIAVIVLVTVMVVVYRNNNPLENKWFPKCGFYVVTGYKCPGCGGQRAVHYLLNGEFRESFKQNPLFHVGWIYIITVLILKSPLMYPKHTRLLNALTGLYACIIWLVGIIAFWILRNIL
ncbi:MAG: DUF2752 domain-containing protein [Bacteroidales bacterium]|nr:DUF2752 domain-containing protein [Bacteroidales bacterium]